MLCTFTIIHKIQNVNLLVFDWIFGGNFGKEVNANVLYIFDKYYLNYSDFGMKQIQIHSAKMILHSRHESVNVVRKEMDLQHSTTPLPHQSRLQPSRLNSKETFLAQ